MDILRDSIIKNTCKYFCLSIDQMKDKTRKREIVTCRQIVQYELKRLTKLSLSEIGKCTGGKDHATILNSIKTVKNLNDTDKNYRKDLNEIRWQNDKIAFNLKDKSIEDIIRPVKKLIVKNRMINRRNARLNRIGKINNQYKKYLSLC